VGVRWVIVTLVTFPWLGDFSGEWWAESGEGELGEGDERLG